MDSPPTPELPPFYRLLTLIGRGNDGVRLAIQGKTQQFKVVDTLYPAQAVDAVVAQLNEQQINVWYEINSAPVVSGGRTTEQDAVALNALYADIDFKEPPAGMGDEHTALELVHMLTGALGVQPAVTLWSGHGLQVYWPVEDGAIDDVNRQDIINLSKRWGLLVQEVARALGGGVDNVFDLARIFRAPGSVNWKNPDKPAPTRIEFTNEGWAPLTVAEISEVLDAHGIRHPDTAELSGEVVSAPDEWAWADADCQYIDIVMDGVKATPASRHHWLLQQATLLTALIRNGCITQATFTSYRLAIQDKLKELLADPSNLRPYNGYEVEQAFRRALLNVQTMPETKLQDEMRRHPHAVLRLMRQAEEQVAAGQPLGRLVNEAGPMNPGPPSTPGPMPDTQVLGNNVIAMQPRAATAAVAAEQFAYTDAANAERLAEFIGDRYIHVPDLGWMVWEDGRYVPDVAGSIMEMSKASLLEFRSRWQHVDAVRDHVAKSLSASGIRNAVRLAETLPGIVVAPFELDADAYALHTPGGVVNLRTASIRDSEPKMDLNTKSTTVTPDWDHPIGRFLAFLEWCFQGDQSMIDYIQLLFGLTLIGEPRNHVLPICTGTGRNGKSTLIQIGELIMGSYAKRMPEDFLIEKHGTTHPTEIANLLGVRFAIAQEAKANGRFAEARVKALTGEKVLAGRFMGKDLFDFPNRVTLWLIVNHLPTVAAGGDSFWRRIRQIAFGNKVSHEVVDLDQQLFNEEGPGILAWMIDGARKVIDGGLQEPEGVKAATKEYQVQEDHLGQWIANNLVVTPGIGALKDTVYERYANYATRIRIPVMAKSVFMREIPHYIEIDRFTTNSTVFGGIALTIEQASYGPLAPPPNVQLTKGALPPSFAVSTGLGILDLHVGDYNDD